MFNRRWLIATLLGIFILNFSACTTSTIKSNELILDNTASNAATVYFIRPTPIRTRGIADSDINVELDEKLAAKLSAGEYIAVKVKPGKIDIGLRSYTYLTSKPMPEEVHRSAEFIFEPGQQYVIHTKFTQEEFRGIYFTPVEISVNEAKQYLKRLKPHGALAKAKPLETL